MTVVGDATVVLRPKYEYEVIEHSEHSRSRHDLRDLLNKLGAEGWLLITEDYEDHLILVRPLAPSRTKQAVTGTVSVVAATTTKGEPMPLTVDAAGVAKFQFDDDLGEPAAAPQGDGSGIAVSFSSDNPSVVSGYGPTSESADANGYPVYTAEPTVVGDGSFNLSASVVNTSGAPLVDDDGSTPFTQPSAVPVSLAAGQATTGTVSED